MGIVFNPLQTTPYSLQYKIKSRVWNTSIQLYSVGLHFFVRKTRVAI